jgi:hypothetical protein
MSYLQKNTTRDTRSYCDKQTEWIKYYNIRGGNLVKVLHKVVSYENGWDNLWSQTMDEYVGKVCKVITYTENQAVNSFSGGIPIEHPEIPIYWCYFPFYVLQPVGLTVVELNTINKEYPHICPKCKGPAYIGMNNVDCKNNCS